MSKIGEYRLGVYELLYRYPIYDYAETVGGNGKRRQNVLILGNGWVGNEAFKACFWAGQAIDANLNITVASQNANSYREEIHKLGGIQAFMDAYASKTYTSYPKTTLDFIEMRVSVNNGKIDLKALALNQKRYNYIIISLGDTPDEDGADSGSKESLNRLVAEAIEAELSKLTYETKPLIAIFGNSGVSEKREKALQQPASAEIVCFNSMGINEASDLLSLAQNINFAYAMYYDERIPLKKANGNFKKALDDEFIKRPKDTPAGNLDVIHNFIGKPYDADSSYAAAVHTGAKLKMCRLLRKGRADLSPEELLAEFILEKGTPYHKLVELEHRRWYAYMATRGYQAPKPEEESAYLYNIKAKTDHRDHTNRMHICMFPSDDRGVKLGNNITNWEIDPNDENAAKKLSELDKASLRAHKIAKKAAEAVSEEVTALLLELDQTNDAISDYILAVNKLLNDDYNAIKLYETAFDPVKPQKEESDPQKILIGKINTLLQVVKARNQRTDFAAIDAQLIDFLPFCLWYRQKYRKVFTISEGVPVKDVVIPTLFCAEHAVFFVVNPKPTNSISVYKDTVQKYFDNRGKNTRVACKIVNSSEQLIDMLGKYREDLCSGEAIINLANSNPNTVISIGQFLSSGEMTAVTYAPIKGIECLAGKSGIGAGLNNKSFSVDEVIELTGGERKKTYDVLPSHKDRESFIQLFKDHYVVEGMNPKEEIFMLRACADFFQQVAKDSSDSISKDKNTTKKTYRTSKIPIKIYNRCGLDSWFKDLEKYHIISAFAKQESGEYVDISFKYREESLITKVISLFEENNSADEEPFTKRVLFIKESGIKTFDLKVRDAYICEKKSAPRKYVEKYLRDLEKHGFIHDLKIETTTDPTAQPDSRVASFVFKDQRTRWLLKQQGAPFEAITYHLFHEFGAFHDVQTGVKIEWRKEGKPLEDYLLGQLKKDKQYGYSHFMDALATAKRRFNANNVVENEIDVIATHGMTPIFGSCKTNTDFAKEWIYEIKSIADHFGAIPVMIVARNCKDKINNAVISRACQMGVSMIGSETLWDHSATIAALDQIKQGRIVSVQNSRKHRSNP